jgi:hypothetical protein
LRRNPGRGTLVSNQIRVKLLATRQQTAENGHVGEQLKSIPQGLKPPILLGILRRD